jgi:hypothetical protein
MEALSEELEGILSGDHVVMLVYATPANGAVLLPLGNFAGSERPEGMVSAINTSVGAWRKLERLRRNPKVALAYHSRTHSESDSQEYVLVQGEATLSAPMEDYPAKIGERWDRFEPWSSTPALWKRWQRIYALRVAIDVKVERVIVWDDLSCGGEARVYGTPLPERPPQSQSEPGKGNGPTNGCEACCGEDGRVAARLAWVGGARRLHDGGTG